MKRVLIIFSAILAILVSLSGCRVTKYIDKPVKMPYAVDDTLRVSTYAVDTIYNRDSIYVDGQTVYKEKWRFKIQIRHDTVWQHKIDSISVPVYLNTTTKIDVPWYNKIFIYIGRICLIAIIICLAIYLIRLYLKR